MKKEQKKNENGTRKKYNAGHYNEIYKFQQCSTYTYTYEKPSYSEVTIKNIFYYQVIYVKLLKLIILLKQNYFKRKKYYILVPIQDFSKDFCQLRIQFNKPKKKELYIQYIITNYSLKL